MNLGGEAPKYQERGINNPSDRSVAMTDNRASKCIIISQFETARRMFKQKSEEFFGDNLMQKYFYQIHTWALLLSILKYSIYHN